jgi:predicted GTPase
MNHMLFVENVIYSGVDYEAIVRAAENDPDGCDVILWDGGNNDFAFYKPDLYVGVADPSTSRS